MGPGGSSKAHFKPQNTPLISQLLAAATEVLRRQQSSRSACLTRASFITASTTELLSPPTAWEILSPHHHAASSALGDPCLPPVLPASAEHQENSLDARSLHVTRNGLTEIVSSHVTAPPHRWSVLLQIRGRAGDRKFLSLWI